MGTRSQELFGAGGWSEAAANAGRRRGRFVLQRLHTDGRRWMNVRHFAVESEAKAALEDAVTSGLPRDRLRIRRGRTSEPSGSFS